MEMVDIINENNQVLYQIAKEEAHREGDLHRCIIAELLDSQGNWILVKQSNERQDAGQYVSPVGGHIQAGETEEAALKRETQEEIGITAFTSKRIGEAIFNREVIGRKENHLFIVYVIYSDQIPKLNHECVGYKKFTPKQLKEDVSRYPQKFGSPLRFIYKTFYE